MLNCRGLIGSLVLTLTLLACSVFAADKPLGFFAGLSGGSYFRDFKSSEIGKDAAIVSANHDQFGWVVGANVGLQIFHHLAWVNGGYGLQKSRATAANGSSVYAVNSFVLYSGMRLDMDVYAKLSAFSQLGVAYVRHDVSGSAYSLTTIDYFSLAYQAGLSYALSDSFQANLSYFYVPGGVVDKSYAMPSMHLFTAGISYYFSA